MQLKGISLEQRYSKELHRQGIPLLLSAMTLRSYSCGQVDVARIVTLDGERCVQLFEIKSTPIFSPKQKKRLQNTAQLIGEVLGLSVQIKFLSSDGIAKKTQSH